MAKTTRGFTLIELMITIAVVAILAAIAYPSYNRFITKAARDEAKSTLQQIELLQEAWRRDNGVYADATALAAQLTALGETDKYSYTITAAGRTSYEAVATAVGKQAAREAAQFSGAGCEELTIIVNLAGVTREPEGCW
ncbi:type IV pilin protein [Thioalkalivibrio sp. XN279]|uniref:type IV pilin protein n=1 Tax=Thioalkalivibrio sp. XN279 TaxID=2714953 RepID=UPI00140AB46D|nr:type IV pilin protein [Thioalkalivibrio sp. XN279]NHA15875.1 prepilin-type N-terminal cleavage/methylation domain-containing protein [Thioalkalivibrio sp. XN279]